MQSAFDSEYDELVDQLNSGDITNDEFHKEVRYLREEYETCAQQAADEAYNNEMDR